MKKTDEEDIISRLALHLKFLSCLALSKPKHGRDFHMREEPVNKLLESDIALHRASSSLNR